jgi:Xaa-Pro aminopeptidase
MTKDTEHIERITKALARAKVDAFICSLPEHVLLLTGYWPVTGVSIAIATRDGDVALLAPKDEKQLAEKSWADELTLFEPGSLNELTSATDAVRSPLKALLKKLKLGRAKLGCDVGPAHQPASYASMHFYGAPLLETVHDVASKTKIESAHDVLARLKSVLTAREIEIVRLACRVGGQSFARGASQIRAGTEEVEIASQFTAPLSIIGTGLPDVKRAGGFAMCMSGPNSAEAHGAYARSRSREAQNGDFVLVHCNSYIDGFWTDITRTYTIGEPNRRQRKIYDAISAARQAALAAIRPGVKAADVDRAARELLGKYGFKREFKHGTGHGVGFVAIDHAAIPRLHPKSPDVLETGMVFNIEPAIYIEGWGGARHCDTVALTTSGVEVLSDFQSNAADLILSPGRKRVAA